MVTQNDQDWKCSSSLFCRTWVTFDALPHLVQLLLGLDNHNLYLSKLDFDNKTLDHFQSNSPYTSNTWWTNIRCSNLSTCSMNGVLFRMTYSFWLHLSLHNLDIGTTIPMLIAGYSLSCCSAGSREAAWKWKLQNNAAIHQAGGAVWSGRKWTSGKSQPQVPHSQAVDIIFTMLVIGFL